MVVDKRGGTMAADNQRKRVVVGLYFGLLVGLEKRGVEVKQFDMRESEKDELGRRIKWGGEWVTRLVHGFFKAAQAAETNGL
jgi:hypothetical protein